MKLDGFYIRRYRNVARQFLPFGGLHVLAGRNGAGKSTILSSVALLGDQPNPFAGLTELGLKAADPRPLGHPPDTGIAAVRIYALDDDLSDDYIVEGGPRSRAVLELVFSILGPAALRNVVSVSDGHHGPSAALLDVDQLRVELNRATRLFRHCGAVSYLATEVPEDFIARLSDYTLPLWKEEFSKWISEYEPTGWRLRYRFAADELLAIIFKARRIAWSRTGGYQGLVIDRSEVSIELGDALSEIAEGYGDHNKSLDGSGYLSMPFMPYDGDSNWYSLMDQLFASLPGYRPATVPPVVDIAQQWVAPEQFLTLSLSPDVGQSAPFADDGVEFVGPVDVDPERRSEIMTAYGSAADQRTAAYLSIPLFERLSSRYHVGPLVDRRSAFLGYWDNPYGPTGFAAVVASGDAAGLTEEVEAALPKLFRHVWAFVNSVAAGSRAVVKLMSPEQQFLFGTHNRGDAALSFSSSTGVWDNKELTVDPWLVRVEADDLDWTLGDAYVRRPGLETVCKLLAHKANEIAPGFVLEGGLIAINLRTVPTAEGGTPNIEVRYDDKLLGDLPAGTARWVAISVRIAGRLLLESKLLLREVWGSDEAEKQRHLDGLPPEQVTALEEINDGIDSYGILQHAFEVLKSDNPYPEFEIIPSVDYSDTVLLVDEPELHLHQDALLDVRKWLSDRTSEREISAVVATHSPIFMDYRPEEATVHGLLTMSDGDAVLTDMTSGLDAWLEGDAEALGVASLDGLFAYRGFLLVEGKHDEKVLRYFYSDELDIKRIGVIPMWGTRDKLDLTEARYLQLTRRPIAMLLDNIPEGNPTGRKSSQEQADLREYIDSFKREGIQFLGDGHGLQDIIYTLPEVAVQRHCEERTGTSPPDGLLAEIGEKMRTELRYEKSEVKKKTVEKMLGLGPTRHGLSANNFIGPVLDQCKDGDRPHETLEKAMLRIWGFFDSHDRYS